VEAEWRAPVKPRQSHGKDLERTVEPQCHARAAALGALGDDLAAVRLGDLADDRETEPGAGPAARGRRAV